jgi:hypothetical protein
MAPSLCSFKEHVHDPLFAVPIVLEELFVQNVFAIQGDGDGV